MQARSIRDAATKRSHCSRPVHAWCAILLKLASERVDEAQHIAG